MKGEIRQPITLELTCAPDQKKGTYRDDSLTISGIHSHQSSVVTHLLQAFQHPHMDCHVKLFYVTTLVIYSFCIMFGDYSTRQESFGKLFNNQFTKDSWEIIVLRNSAVCHVSLHLFVVNI